MEVHKLSVLIPVFNEESAIVAILDALSRVELKGGTKIELIVVDDGSTDCTLERVSVWRSDHPNADLQVVEHAINQGNGAALHSGIARATGDYLVVQAANLEYDPAEYDLLLDPVRKGHADVVYGSRFQGGKAHRVLFFGQTVSNTVLTFLSNVGTNLNLTDIDTSYKLFRTDIIQGLSLEQKGFGFAPEVTAKVARVRGVRIYEVGISYYGRADVRRRRTCWRKAGRALACIIRYNFFKGFHR